MNTTCRAPWLRCWRYRRAADEIPMWVAEAVVFSPGCADLRLTKCADLRIATEDGLISKVEDGDFLVELAPGLIAKLTSRDFDISFQLNAGESP